MRILILILLCLYFTACKNDGGGSAASSSGDPGPPYNTGLSCTGNQIRKWRNLADNSTVQLYNNCSGRMSHCGYTFTFSQPNGLGDTVLTIVTNNGQAGCWPVGNYNCRAFYWERFPDKFMDLDCGQGIDPYIGAP